MMLWPMMLWTLLFLAQEPPDVALRRLRTADDLQVRMFAHEPQLFNPACIDVDEKGRVWVAEAVNYRRWAGPKSGQPPYYLKPHRPTGDRIVILEDKDGDGACDSSTVFYEGLDLQAPMGIAVVGDKVWIAQAPTVFTIEIKPDGTAGRKETALTGFRGLNGDHSIHSSYVGPDGKFYHCLGDNGGDVRFPDGRRLVNDGKPWIGGIIFRTNLDLTGLEVLAHNHRNQVECATDSFGNTFTTDNDHDGRQWVRFHYAMEGGDFGWMGPKGSHWRMESPGVVPILMRTGAGSPAGMCIYEGSLLPEKYRGMPMQADAVGVVQCFRLTPDGAAWRVAGAPEGRQTIETLSEIRKPDALLSCKDGWFRPSDVAVAPDGSVFVADWYDSVVGGGGMEDTARGRIYRLLPKGHDGSYRPPRPADLAGQLASPCVATRTRGVLRADPKELAPLTKSPDRFLRARAIALLGGDAAKEALRDADPAFRVLAIRTLRLHGVSFAPPLRDPSAQVRRELLLALRDRDAVEELVELALQYDGYDRWYLEAVAIAFRGREEKLAERLTGWDRRIGGLLWVLRRPDAVARAAAVGSVEAVEVLGSFNQLEAGDAVLRALGKPELRKAAFAVLERNLPVVWKGLAEQARPAIEPYASDPSYGRVLAALGLRPLTRWRLSPAVAAPDCADFDRPHAVEKEAEPEKLPGWKDARVSLEGQIDLRPQCSPNVNAFVYAVALLRAPEAMDARLLLGSDDAVHVFVNGRRVWDRHAHRELTSREDTIPIRLEAGVNRLMLKVENRAANWCFLAELDDPGRRIVEAPLGPLVSSGEKLDLKKLPPASELLAVPGDRIRGREVYFRSKADCGKCHRVRGEGGDIGPELSVIGLKFNKEGFLTSILRPSDAVAPEFTQWAVRTKAGDVRTGVIVEDTADRLVLKDPEGKRIELSPKEIDARQKSDLSPMPDSLVGELTRQDLADLLEYLVSLK